MPQESSKDAEKEKVMRSRRGTVDTELSALQSSLDVDDAPYRARLYQLFGLIEKEFDSLYAENCACQFTFLPENSILAQFQCVLELSNSLKTKAKLPVLLRKCSECKSQWNPVGRLYRWVRSCELPFVDRPFSATAPSSAWVGFSMATKTASGTWLLIRQEMFAQVPVLIKLLESGLLRTGLVSLRTLVTLAVSTVLPSRQTA